MGLQPHQIFGNDCLTRHLFAGTASTRNHSIKQIPPTLFNLSHPLKEHPLIFPRTAHPSAIKAPPQTPPPLMSCAGTFNSSNLLPINENSVRTKSQPAYILRQDLQDYGADEILPSIRQTGNRDSFQCCQIQATNQTLLRIPCFSLNWDSFQVCPHKIFLRLRMYAWAHDTPPSGVDLAHVHALTAKDAAFSLSPCASSPCFFGYDLGKKKSNRHFSKNLRHEHQ